MLSSTTFLKYTSPVIVIALAVILAMHEHHAEECRCLESEIQNQARQNSKLEGENDSLKKEMESLKVDKYRYIKLDVAGV